MAFSDNVKKSREKQGYSQEELARCLGIAQAQIAKYETGISVPNIVIGVKLAQKLGTTCEELVKSDPTT